MLKRWLGLFPALFALFLGACTGNPEYMQKGTSSEIVQTGVYQKISPQQAKSMMEESEPYLLLDVRTQEEFKEKRIDGAVLIPDYELKNRASAELPDKNALILIYCRSGRRSALAAKNLIDLGYTNVYDFGGIIDWSYATVSGW